MNLCMLRVLTPGRKSRSSARSPPNLRMSLKLFITNIVNIPLSLLLFSLPICSCIFGLRDPVHKVPDRNTLAQRGGVHLHTETLPSVPASVPLANHAGRSLPSLVSVRCAAQRADLLHQGLALERVWLPETGRSAQGVQVEENELHN